MTQRHETWAEEVARLQREIGDRQRRLHFLVLGDQSKGISGQGFAGLPEHLQPTGGRLR